jgi:hypothetical protein
MEDHAKPNRSAAPQLRVHIFAYRPELELSECNQHAVTETEFPTNNGPADYALILDGSLG